MTELEKEKRMDREKKSIVCPKEAAFYSSTMEIQWYSFYQRPMPTPDFHTLSCPSV